MHTKAVYQGAKGLTRIGCAVLRFNFRGVGSSEGAFDEGAGEMEDFRAGLDYMAALIPINARSFIHVTLIIFDTKDEAQTRAAYDVAKRLVRDCAKLGYGEYRAHLDFMDLAAEQYSFGDHVQRRFNETIKDALDPNGILSPGKQKIWPRAMRNGARPG